MERTRVAAQALDPESVDAQVCDLASFLRLYERHLCAGTPTQWFCQL